MIGEDPGRGDQRDEFLEQRSRSRRRTLIVSVLIIGAVVAVGWNHYRSTDGYIYDKLMTEGEAQLDAGDYGAAASSFEEAWDLVRGPRHTKEKTEAARVKLCSALLTQAAALAKSDPGTELQPLTSAVRVCKPDESPKISVRMARAYLAPGHLLAAKSEWARAADEMARLQTSLPTQLTEQAIGVIRRSPGTMWIAATRDAIAKRDFASALERHAKAVDASDGADSNELEELAVQVNKGLHERGAELLKAGELAEAAKRYNLAGAHAEAAPILSKLGRHKEAGDAWSSGEEPARAGDEYITAKEWALAAQARVEEKRWLDAAGLFVKAKMWGHAAEAYEHGKALRQAADAYLKDEDGPAAARVYEKLGDWKGVGDARMIREQFDAAARAYSKAGDAAGLAKALRGLVTTEKDDYAVLMRAGRALDASKQAAPAREMFVKAAAVAQTSGAVPAALAAWLAAGELGKGIHRVRRGCKRLLKRAKEPQAAAQCMRDLDAYLQEGELMAKLPPELQAELAGLKNAAITQSADYPVVSEFEVTHKYGRWDRRRGYAPYLRTIVRGTVRNTGTEPVGSVVLRLVFFEKDEDRFRKRAGAWEELHSYDRDRFLAEPGSQVVEVRFTELEPGGRELISEELETGIPYRRVHHSFVKLKRLPAGAH